MTLQQTPDAEHRRRSIRALQLLVVVLFFVQLVTLYLIPLRSRTLGPEWWTWVRAAAPLLALGVLELASQRRVAPRLQGEAAERIRWERPRRYGRTH